MKAFHAYQLSKNQSIELANQLLDKVYRTIEQRARTKADTHASLYSLCPPDLPIYGDLVYRRCLKQLEHDGYRIVECGTPLHALVYWDERASTTPVPQHPVSDLGVE